MRPERPPRWTSNFLGMGAWAWLRLLQENGFAIDPPFWPRAAAATASSLVSSAAGLCDAALLLGKKPAPLSLPGPIFVVGHWRSGTTWLHVLLARDPAFAAPNLYDVMFPHSFLTLRPALRRAAPALLPEQRLHDNMSADPELAQEDEFALALMTRASPYLSYTFPRRWRFYDRYLSFDGVEPRIVRRWARAFTRYVAKLRIVYGKPLVLKSPPHTARIGLILELFPDARFVHIHRHPYEVFQSTRLMLATLAPLTQLQRLDALDFDEIALHRYATLMNAFLRQYSAIPQHRYCEIAFADLKREPRASLRAVYGALGLDALGGNPDAVADTLARADEYVQNSYSDLAAPLKQAVRERVPQAFERWGYAP
jgi:omega-hydroxy-beta-dihydromenaquinone-9 sulfotransferase